MKVLFFIGYVCLVQAVQAKFYDVTTIYRLADYPPTVNETDNKAKTSQAGDCFVGVGSNRCKGWLKQGWTPTDSGLFGVTFPSTVVEQYTLEASSGTAKLKLPSTMFDVSVTFSGDSTDNITFVFSTEEDDLESHLIVLQTSKVQGTEAAYRCLIGQGGLALQLPNGKERMCSTIVYSTTIRTKVGIHTEVYRIYTEPSRLKIGSLNSERSIFDFQYIKQLKDLKFLSVAVNGSVTVSAPTHVLQLSDMWGSLVSPAMTHANSAHICISFSTFMDPRSDSSLTLYAQYASGKRLDIGVVTASANSSIAQVEKDFIKKINSLRSKNEDDFPNKDALKVKSQQWKFVKFVDPSEIGTYMIHIEADMLSRFPVLISDIASCKENELVEVHARTNARGMPFSLYNRTAIDSNVGAIVPVSFAGSFINEWKMENWESGYSEHVPLLDTGTHSGPKTYHEWTSGDNTTMAMPYDGFQKFTFVPKHVQQSNSESVMNILLLNQPKYIANTPMYMIRIQGRSSSNIGEKANIYKCGSNNCGEHLYINSNLYICCRRMYTSPNVNSAYNWYKKVVTGIDVTLTVVKGKITVKVNNTLILDWTDSDPLNVQSYMFSTRYMAGEFVTLYDVFALSKESGTMVSPVIDFSSRNICVVLDYYMDEGGSIEVTAHASGNNRDFVIGTGKINNSKQSLSKNIKDQGWKHDLFLVEIPEKYVNQLGQVLITGTKDTKARSSVLIQRIAGCNAEALEDVYVFPNASRPIIHSPGFDVAAFDRTEKLSTKSCYYGGKMSANEKQCICPAGFTGISCDKGCGANRYGNDCGGKCSATSRECRGMLLCRPLLGCTCAPGFTGSLCDTPCLEGRFGANCEQRCGHCLNTTQAGGKCNRFTGKCRQGCEPGFYPPLCIEEYAYLRTAPILENVGNTLKVSSDVTELSEMNGNPTYMQIQYRYPGQSEWTKMTPIAIDYETMTKQASSSDRMFQRSVVTGLKPGREYQFRVVTIDQDGSSYQGDNLSVSEIKTSCTVPEKFDFNFQSVNITEDSFGVQWMDPFANTTWCPVEKYELYRQMGWLWIKNVYDETSLSDEFKELLPSNTYRIKMRAITALGTTSYSTLVVKTLQAIVLGQVLDLEAPRNPTDASTKIVINWNPPENEDEVSVRRYKITYQCLRLLACPDTDCSSSAGQVEARTTSAILGDLLPFARYNITVSALSGSLGLPTSIQKATDGSAPKLAPVMSKKPLVDRTNSSFTVRWESPDTCAGMNGYLIGYHYQLENPNQSSPMIEGDTTTTSARFAELDPGTEYAVKVYAVTSSGWNSKHPLKFTVKTRATTPAVVRNLTVYKRGRRMLGLRWSKPLLTYGALRSFTVTHKALGEQPISTTVLATRCTAWPDLYCHTINNLTPDQEYTVSVQARNSEVNEDGDEMSVVGLTKEGAPGAPSSLKLVNQTSSSVTIEWKLPEMINGVLRTFLINIEETDSVNSTDCCQYFPLKEVTVKSEEPHYHFQLSDLRPASTYLVSVTGKTVSLGASISLTAHTRPLTPVLDEYPQVIGKSSTWRRGEPITVRVKPTLTYQDTASGYMVFVATNETGGAALEINDEWLLNELNGINETLYFVAEYTVGQLEGGQTLELVGNETPVKGRFGVLSFPRPTAAISYQLVQVLVLDYCGSLSMGYVRGDGFSGE